jgi:hypothetical protein
MSEETKLVEIYYYYKNGVQLWTSNEDFAKIRAIQCGSKLYFEPLEISE